MTTEQLEVLLQGADETQSLEFKTSTHWSEKTFVKDLLAMANVEYGGHIIIGVSQVGQQFKREGITSTDQKSYRIDEMRDQIGRYADPNVEFSITFPKGADGLVYGVIRVEPFRTLPVVCKKGGADVHAGQLYYRNSNRRPESAPVSNSHDMHSIIERAAVNRMKRLKEHGLDVRDDMAVLVDKLDKELGGL